MSERIAGVLGARVGWGAVSVSLGDLLAFAIVVWLTFLVSQALRAVLEEDVFARVEPAARHRRGALQPGALH